MICKLYLNNAVAKAKNIKREAEVSTGCQDISCHKIAQLWL